MNDAKSGRSGKPAERLIVRGVTHYNYSAQISQGLPSPRGGNFLATSGAPRATRNERRLAGRTSACLRQQCRRSGANESARTFFAPRPGMRQHLVDRPLIVGMRAVLAGRHAPLA